MHVYRVKFDKHESKSLDAVCAVYGALQSNIVFKI